MSIKKLFDSTNKNRNYLSDTDEKNAFESVESERNVRAIKTTQDTFVPQIDYERPIQFAQYGSAYLYYKSAIERIHDYYPYDGSDAEINEFYNGCLPIEQYIFDNRYPRTTGYITMSVGGWGTKTNALAASGGYGVSNSTEYITLYGGPNTISHTKLQEVFPNPHDDNYQYSNIYDTDIYTTAGLPSDYGSGSRESNLQSDFDKGVTVEFWFKTGSAVASDTYANETQKEVIFDLWNNELSSSTDYGRITIAINTLTSSSPFIVTVQSGTEGSFERAIGTGSWTGSVADNTYCLSSWKHYAFSMYNSGSDFTIKLHVDGKLKDTYTSSSMTLGELNSKNMMGRLGGLLTAPSGTLSVASSSHPGPSGLSGGGKLAGSLDEFRFWKGRRNSNEIGRYWKSQVRGGTNTDISNTTLGVYYKFNEGITTSTSLDSTVLDYSGRVSNGVWTGYVATSRNTGSAMVSASVRTSEYLDPVVYSAHPSVSSLKTELLNKGEKYDLGNNSAFVNMMPSWVLEEDESLTSDLRKMSHVVATYLDKLRLQIEALPTFKGSIYTTASAAPVPFAQHLPQSLGLYTPDLFVDADVMERFLNRDQNTFFEGDLTEAKNLIYLNLYNNLAGIYKAKGTEKAIKNIFRCFNINDKLVRLKTYSNNHVYDLQDNLQQFLYEDVAVNCNVKGNLAGVVYQRVESDNSNAIGFISGTYGAAGGAAIREGKYGLTTEANVTFPSFNWQTSKSINRDFLTSSLFGMYTVNTASATSRAGTNVTFTTGSQDFANFQVLAIRDRADAKSVRFMLTSSQGPSIFGTFPGANGQSGSLTSSNFFDVYDDEEWHFSVRVKPSTYPVTSLGLSGDSNYNYIIEFRGINAVLDTIQNNFLVTASISQSAGRNLLQAAKRLYLGARRTNITGTVLNRSDVLFGSMKYYAKYVEDGILDQHLYNERNVGISSSYQNISPLDPSLTSVDALNSNTLALDWTFNNITASDGSGNFYYVQDVSSGSAARRAEHWIGGIAGYQHTGYGYGFNPNATNVISKDLYNALKFTDPEAVLGSDMVQVLDNEDIVFGALEPPPSFFQVIEKSMYNAISEEMLLFFAGAIDFQNIIGEPVNRYRDRYKTLEKLRQTFFRRVTTVSTVEKFIDYYKWFDDALALIVQQLLPASSEFVSDVAEVVESHVLERNKYQTPFPTIEFEEPDLPDAIPLGIDALEVNYNKEYSSPTPSSTRPTDTKRDFWKLRADRYSPEISASGTGLNAERTTIKNTIGVSTEISGTKLKSADGTSYTRTNYLVRHKSRPYALSAEMPNVAETHPFLHSHRTYGEDREIKGGTNFTLPHPRMGFLYNATRPAGPVNEISGAYEGYAVIPLNVLLAPMSEIVEWDEIQLNPANRISGSKEKRYFKVYYGPDYQGGLGSYNLKSTLAFPFNIMSSSVSGGFNKQVVEGVSPNLELTNLHNDVYGPEMEQPMQGPFTEDVVGGHQSRHVPLNRGATDNYTNRPEAWKILLGTCGTSTEPPPFGGVVGAIGVAGADYPWPEANAVGESPYPMTASQKAIYYRGFTAKSPVNIRNIKLTSSLTSSQLGNYSHNYEVVSTFGAYSNPRQFVENAPTLSNQITQTPSGTQGRTFLDIHRDAEGHFQFTPDYSVGYFTASTGKSVISTRFASPGGVDTMGIGYKDIRSAEFSVYNAPSYRNWSVARPFQNMALNVVSEVTGVGTPGIRVSDINGLDIGWDFHLKQHCAQFGRSSLIYPPDSQRPTYTLADNFMGYSSTDIYRAAGSLQGWWRLRTSVDWGADSSGKGRTGTFPSSPDKPEYSGSAGPSRYVQTSSAGWDGGDERMNIGSAATWDAIIGNDTGGGSTEKMTFAAWFYKTGDGGGTRGRIIDFGDTDIALFSKSAERVRFTAKWNGDNAVWWQTVDANVFPEDAWIHIAVTYDATDSANDPIIYINGAAQASEHESGTKTGAFYGISGDACFVANRYSADRGFEGQLCDVGVWNSVLTQTDITAIYNESKTPYQAGPGVIDNQSPSMYKVNRNPRKRLRKVGDSYITSSQFDNFYVQHQIPRADRQYAWVTGAIVTASDIRYDGMAPVAGPLAGYYSSSATGYTAYFDFITSSDIGHAVQLPGLYQPAKRLNIFVRDPVDLTTNTLGISGLPSASVTNSYNNTLLDVHSSTPYGLNLEADYLNLLLTKRRSAFKTRNVPLMSPVKNQILQKHAQQSQITVVDGASALQTYAFKPVSMRGRPLSINMDINRKNSTFTFTWNNELLYCSDQTLNQMLEVKEDKVTLFDQTMKIANSNVSRGRQGRNGRPVYNINWVLYSEMMFPSRVNAFTSESSERPNYDNKFWRTTAADRLAVGRTIDSTKAFEWYNLNGPDWNSTTSYSYTAKSSLVAWWRLNTDIATAGGEVDSSGNGHASTETSGAPPDWPDPAVTPSSFIQANTNYFDGTTSGLNVSSDNALSFTDGAGADTAASFHFRFNGTFDEAATPSYYYLAYKGNGTSSGHEYQIYMRDGDADGTAALYVSFYDTDGDYIGAIATTSLNSSQWYDVVVTYDGSESADGIKVYVDGEEVATTTSNSGTYGGMSRTGHPLYLANYGAAYDFKGYLGDIAFWNSALTVNDIKALYNAKTGAYRRGVNSFNAPVSQSSWPLDASSDFLTRTNVPTVPVTASSRELCLSNTAGELQNTYFQIVSITGSGDRDSNVAIAMAPSGLLARKHTLASARSIVSPTGRQVSATGSLTYGDVSASYNQRLGEQLFMGESEWQADSQAGILVKTGTGDDAKIVFESHASEPFFYNSYDDYIKDIRLIAKDYAIVPEFRISEHVDEYLKTGIEGSQKFDWAAIPGAYTDSGEPVDSAQTGFYKDYSNSEFAHHFLEVKRKSGLEPAEIMLEVNAAVKFNPYKGFYPQQRTLDLISQFSKSFGTSLVSTSPVGAPVQTNDAAMRPLMQALFAPGILYNTIKSGMAVDYPIVTDGTKFTKSPYGYETASVAGKTQGAILNAATSSTNLWMMSSTGAFAPILPNNVTIQGYNNSSSFWDQRITFEDFLNPDNLRETNFIDFEPHPSCSISGLTTSLMAGQSDQTYGLMASNFCGGLAKFFLKGHEFTTLESEVVPDGLRFEAGSFYGARLKLRRSTDGLRTYGNESGSSGNNAAYGRAGGKVYNTSTQIFLKQTFPLPQDPRQQPDFHETFTMESRPSSFGPPIAGRPTASAIQLTASLTHPADSMNGFYWSHTPPYYNGEAWVDFVFEPTATDDQGRPVTYDLEKILGELETKYWRCDPGISASGTRTGATAFSSSTQMVGTQLLPTFSGNCGYGSIRQPGAPHPAVDAIGTSEIPLIYGGQNINANAMQLSASVNIFGVKRVLDSSKDKFGNQISTQNKTVGAKWVIQPKMETPHLNFNHLGDHPVSASTPLYGSASVSRGIWRQFGIMEPDPNKGVFLEIGPIPTQWLKNHYDVITYESMYNRGNPTIKGAKAYQNIKPLTNVIKFKVKKRSARLGEIANSQTIKEAIVVVPYKIGQPDSGQTRGGKSISSIAQATKQFFGINPDRINAAGKDQIGSKAGDSLDAAGLSIREMLKKMECYVLPPWADFVRNDAVDPFVMYFLEFEYHLDKDDLSYIYQGLAPRNSKNMTLNTRKVAHKLNPAELLSAKDVLDPTLRWMVFKVKQRSMAAYEDLVVPQAGQTTDQLFDFETGEGDYQIGYNWPYDYVSIVESIKFDVKVLYKKGIKKRR